MKQHILWLGLVVLLSFSFGANAFWNNNWGNNGWNQNYYDWNPYDVWDPRYWAEEMEDMFDGNDWWGNNQNYNAYPNMYRNIYQRMPTMPVNQEYLPKYNPYIKSGW